MSRRYVKAVVNLVLALLMLLLIIFVVPKILIFFMPFLIGWIISLIAAPLVKFLEEKLKIRRRISSVLVIASVIAGIIVLFYAAVVKLAREAAGFIESLPAIWESIEEDFYNIGQNLNVLYDRLPKELQSWLTTLSLDTEDYIGELVSDLSTPTFSAVGSFAQNVPSVIIGVIMCLLASYFLIADRDVIYSFCRRYMPAYVQEKWHILADSLRTAVGGYFKAQLKIEVWIYLLMVIGFLILRIDYALLIALGVAALDFLPVFGTGAVLWPWALVKFLSGDYVTTIGLMLIWGIGQLARQIIQPKIVGDSIGLAPMPTLLLLYIGYRLGSVLGMIIAIPVGIILVNLYTAGAFDTTKESILILVRGLNSFRRLTDEDKDQKSGK